MLLPRPASGCPYLILAPMEGVGDAHFRKALLKIGGFDEAVRDFIRVPRNCHVQSLAEVYDAEELSPTLLAPQIMGGDPELMAVMACELVRRGAHRIDINCGCPSNTVNGRGAGASLLRDTSLLFSVVKAVSSAVTVPVTVKMRSGYHDTLSFRENIKAVEDAGAAYITLHPRTKVEGYKGAACWELIAEAKSILKIPVVGNGDITTADDAVAMVKMTGCDAMMIGRGCIVNPFLFHEIRARFSGVEYVPQWQDLYEYLYVYLESLPVAMRNKFKVNKMKQLFRYLFDGNDVLRGSRREVLSYQHDDVDAFVEHAIVLLRQGYN
jgi:nifR3 family TIM-barrel protein